VLARGGAVDATEADAMVSAVRWEK
jgi:hypothetical protein